MEGEQEPQTVSLPPSLLDFLSNSLVLDATLPYLPLASLFALARASRDLWALLLKTPHVFRFVDLSRCRGAYVSPAIKVIDSGGQTFRSQRIDENLTEDEFYSGPLRGVLSRLSRLNVLRDIHTLVLDGLASVTVDLVSDILQDGNYNIRMLSVINCINLNARKLQQLLCYICREGRLEGTPRLQGLYVFGKTSLQNHRRSVLPSLLGVTLSDGAQLGVAPGCGELPLAQGTDAWYSPSGRILNEGYAQRSSWEETLQKCKGIIAFDGVLCTHMHAALEPCMPEPSRDFLSEVKPGISPLATIALGPEGCASCGKAPAGSPIWNQSNCMEFPLLSPPPFSGKLIDACRPPPRMVGHGDLPMLKRLIAGCTWCLSNRHCESCHRWWCGNCFDPSKKASMEGNQRERQRLEESGLGYLQSSDGPAFTDSISRQAATVKRSVVTKGCWDCGMICAPCDALATHTCRRCGVGYCFFHNTGCDEKTCDWCMFRGGRRLKELY